MKLRERTYSAVRWTSAIAICRALLQLTQVVVLTRLLSPADFGLMAIVTVIIGISSQLTDGGLHRAYIQRQTVSPEERSSLYWLGVALGCVACLLLAGLSPLLAMIFGDSRLAPLITGASLLFIATSLGQQLRMTAEKQLDFRRLFSIDLVSTLSGFLVALCAAYYGLGVYSLVLAVLVTAIVSSALAWLLLADGWRPMWRMRLGDVRPFLGFGLALTANNLVNELNRSIDLLLGGRLLTTSALGLYSVPRQLVFYIQGLVNPVITRVSFPLIARIQHDIPRVRRVYLQSVNMIASTNAPIYLGMAAFSPQLVALLFGEQWQDAATVLRILAVWGGIRTLGNPVGTLLLGMGRARLSLKWNLFQLLLVPPAIWIGSQSGVNGIAWALLIVVSVIIPLMWYFLVNPLCKAGFVEYMTACFRAFVLAALSIAPAYFVCSGIENPLICVIAAAALVIPIYAGLSFKFNRPWFNAMMQLASGLERGERLPLKNNATDN